VTDRPYLAILRDEFAAEDSSFLIHLRCDLKWDKRAFLRLVTAMEQCCADIEDAKQVERWLADGFWYVSWFVQSWATHQNFRWEFAPDYYEGASRLLVDLASYFFSGCHPYEDGRFSFIEEISKDC
jgi:hypothetical protein